MTVDPFALESYDFELPESLIAQTPCEPRDASRLLVLHRTTGLIEHRVFRDLPGYLDSKDLLVANNTRVIQARLLGYRIPDGGASAEQTSGGQIEFLLLEPDPSGMPSESKFKWEGLFRSSARQRPGLRFRIPVPGMPDLVGTLLRSASESRAGTTLAEFDRDPVASGAGVLPLPPYITRTVRPEDQSRYQTLYAKNPGSSAAPTAGLHFTESVMASLRERKVGWQEITLNIGLGTFRPVKVEDIRDHVMHEESYEISAEAADRISEHKREGGRLTAVGTTAVRTLESAWNRASGRLTSGAGKTALFIYPHKATHLRQPDEPYDQVGQGEAGAIRGEGFSCVDRLITNFHLPKSSLLMLVCAFAGREAVLHAYREAVREKYRFFSYGDAMLIL